MLKHNRLILVKNGRIIIFIVSNAYKATSCIKIDVLQISVSKIYLKLSIVKGLLRFNSMFKVII